MIARCDNNASVKREHSKSVYYAVRKKVEKISTILLNLLLNFHLSPIKFSILSFPFFLN